jgi:hypothetical protein
LIRLLDVRKRTLWRIAPAPSVLISGNHYRD